MTKDRQDSLESGDAKLFRRRWRPVGAAKAKLLLVHGFGEHGGRYGNVVDKVLPLGVSIDAYDQRGHGRSSGQRGFVRGWSEFRRDLTAVLAALEADDPVTPTFLYGHSMGGLVALDFALREKPALAGLIVSGPLLGTPGVPAFLLTLGRLMSRIWPRFSLDSKLDVNAISRDPAVVEDYRNDPLVHSRGTARLSTEITRTQRWVQAHAAELELPLLMLHGGADAIAPPEDGRVFFDAATSADKERIEYPGGHHEPHNDTNREVVLGDVARWLGKRL